MNLLVRWGVRILFIQVILGMVTYVAPGGEEAGIGPALLVAGVVAAIFIVVSIVFNDEVVTAVASSSLAAMLAIFCILGEVFVFASFFGLSCFATAFVAAMVVKYKGLGGGETTSELVLDALPVIGAVRYLLFCALDKKANGT